MNFKLILQVWYRYYTAKKKVKSPFFFPFNTLDASFEFIYLKYELHDFPIIAGDWENLVQLTLYDYKFMDFFFIQNLDLAYTKLFY